MPIVIQRFVLTSLTETQDDGGVCRSTFAWSVTGASGITVQILRDGDPILNNGQPSGSFADPFAPGNWTYVLRAIHGPTGQSVDSDNIDISPICIRSFTATPNGCAGVGLAWNIDGVATGSISITRNGTPLTIPGGNSLPARNDGSMTDFWTGGSITYRLRASVGGRTVDFQPPAIANFCIT